MNSKTPRGARPLVLRAKLLTAAVVVAASLLLLVTLGAFLPIPLLDMLGAAASSFAPFTILAAAAVLVAAVLLLRRRRTRARISAIVMSALALIGIGVMLGSQLTTAVRHDVAIDPLRLFVPEAIAEPDADVAYTTGPDDQPVELSVYRPAGGATDAPVLFWTHGGGWVSGERMGNTGPSHASWFAARGYLVISADYTLSSEARHLWDSTEEQLACALVWTATHASEYGGDASRLFTAGESAGGQLAMQLAYRSAAGTLESSCGGGVPQVRAVSALYPGADLAGIHENDHLVLGSLIRSMAESYTGGTPSEVPDRYAMLTPSNNLSDRTPPTLIAQGTNDHMVPAETNYGQAEALTSAGVDNTLITVPFGEHSFDTTTAIATQVWRQATLQWFQERGA